MYLDDTPCCAVQIIDDLAGHDTPESAMESFCQNHFTSYGNYFSTPSAFIIFTGVEKVVDVGRGYCSCGSRKVEKCKDDPDYCECECHTEVKYGSKFAKFIKDLKLGKVVATKAMPNRVNHPNHIVKVWSWTPDKDRLKKWFYERKGIK